MGEVGGGCVREGGVRLEEMKGCEGNGGVGGCRVGGG